MVTVEFFGIARQRAGVSQLEIFSDSSQPMPLREVLTEVVRQIPQAANQFIDDGRLCPGFMACISGREFTCDPEAAIPHGASLMILSADAGG